MEGGITRTHLVFQICAGDYALGAACAMHISSMVSLTVVVISDMQVLNQTCSTGTDEPSSTTYTFDLVAFVEATYILSLRHGKRML